MEESDVNTPESGTVMTNTPDDQSASQPPSPQDPTVPVDQWSPTPEAGASPAAGAAPAASAQPQYVAPQQYVGQQQFGQLQAAQAGQPGYVQPQYAAVPGQPQFAGQVVGAPVGGYLPPSPSGGTAIAAGILALLGVIHMLVLFFAAVGANEADLPEGFAPWITFQAAEAAISMVLLGVGGVMLLMRKALGRYLVYAGCLVHAAAWVVSYAATRQFLDDVALNSQMSEAYQAGLGIGFFIFLIFPLVTLGLAMAPSTGRWLDYAKPAVAVPGVVPQQPYAPGQFGQPQQMPQQGVQQPGVPPQQPPYTG